MTMTSLDNNGRTFSKEQMGILLKSEDYEINSGIRLLEQSMRDLDNEKFHDPENGGTYNYWKHLAKCQCNKLITELNNRDSSFKRPLKEDIELRELLHEAALNFEN